MATLPSASLTINEQAGAFAGSTGYLVVAGCVPQSADSVPRVMSSTQDLLNQYGYCQAVDYCARHFLKTRKPVIFVGLPVVTPGSIGSQNNTLVTGTSAITVTAASSGVMDQCSVTFTVLQGVNVGTDQIILNLSCDGGISFQRVRVGSATSYTIPFLGIVLNFGAGTLNPGDVFTFQTFAPMWGSAALALAQTNLAAQQNLARSWLVVGDLPNSTFAGYVTTATNNYETSNQRYVYARAQVTDRLPLATKSMINVTAILGTATVTFAATGHTITRSAGSFITDGFQIGQVVTVAGSTSNNGILGALTGVSATVLTFAAGVVNEGPDASGVTITASEGITFAAAGFTITRAGGGNFVNDGFAVGMNVSIAGTTSNNTASLALTGVTATVLTFASGLVNEGPDVGTAVTIQQVQTVSAWVSAQTAAFATVDAQRRIDLGLGRGRAQSPITNWTMRRPVQWAATEREYNHDVQIPCWRKSDGPLDGWALVDVSGNLQEFDERVYGGGLAGRFTCMRSYGNGPLGAFIALSLTRDSEGLTLSRTQNMAVADLAESVVQAETENAIGQVLVLNSDGTGTDASLSLIEQRVNSSLQRNLLQQFQEGPRASNAVWAASRLDILNVVGATMHGTLTLNLNGTVEQIATTVRVS